MPNYCQRTGDHTKQIFMDISLTVTQMFWERLHKLGLENSVFNDNGNENIFKILIFSILSAVFLLLFPEKLPFIHTKVKHYVFVNLKKMVN